MVLLILFAVWFYSAAKKRGLSAILWAIIGGVSYFVGQLLGLSVIGNSGQQFSSEDRLYLIVIGIISGVVGVLIAYAALVQAGKNKQTTPKSDEKILDNSNSETILDSTNSENTRNKIHDDIS